MNSLACFSETDQKCEVRSEIININTNEPVFYPYSIKMIKCKGSCNTINAKISVPIPLKT